MRRIVFRTALVLCCMFLFAVQASAAGADFQQRAGSMAEITGVRVSTEANKTRVVIDADRPVSFRKILLDHPDRVVIDIPKAWLSPKAKKDIAVNSRFVGRVRAAQFNPDTVRIVMESKVGRGNHRAFSLQGGPVPARVVLDIGDLSPDSSQASIRLPGQTGDAAGQAPEKPAKNPAAAKPAGGGQKPDKKTDKKDDKKPDQPAVQPSHSDSEGEDELAGITGLRGRKITIDAGHGGNDSGAIGPTGVMEKSVTLRVANELKRLLAAEGATVYMTRETDTEVSPKGADASDIEELQARCDVGNRNGSDIFISIHMDSFSNGAARGTTGYYYSLGSQKSRDLADKVRSGVIDQLGTQSRGTQSCNFYVCKHTDMPATLVELAFISNPSEEKLMDSEDGIHKAAQGIADGIADYFG